jgi:excisionase family DNA binding protein
MSRETEEPALNLPATVSIEEAGRVLGYGRDTAYAAARNGKLPTILIGKRKRRVPMHRLLELLSSSDPQERQRPALDRAKGAVESNVEEI